MENLEDKLKGQIIDQLRLEDMTPADISNDTPLFGEGLGLDSIDALELIVLLEKHYGLKLKSPEEGKDVFGSINNMADYIRKHKAA